MKSKSFLSFAILAVALPFAAVLTSHAAEKAKDKACSCGETCKSPCNKEKSEACAAGCAKKDADKAACDDCKCGSACKAESAPKADKCEAGCSKK